MEQSVTHAPKAICFGLAVAVAASGCCQHQNIESVGEEQSPVVVVTDATVVPDASEAGIVTVPSSVSASSPPPQNSVAMVFYCRGVPLLIVIDPDGCGTMYRIISGMNQIVDSENSRRMPLSSVPFNTENGTEDDCLDCGARGRRSSMRSHGKRSHNESTRRRRSRRVVVSSHSATGRDIRPPVLILLPPPLLLLPPSGGNTQSIETCDKVLASEVNLVKTACQFCTKEFPQPNRCRRHEAACRSNPDYQPKPKNIKSGTCNYCHKEFSRPWDCEQHEARWCHSRPDYQPKPKKPKTCKYCHKVFSTAWNCEQHEAKSCPKKTHAEVNTPPDGPDGLQDQEYNKTANVPDCYNVDETRNAATGATCVASVMNSSENPLLPDGTSHGDSSDAPDLLGLCFPLQLSTAQETEVGPYFEELESLDLEPDPLGLQPSTAQERVNAYFDELESLEPAPDPLGLCFPL